MNSENSEKDKNRILEPQMGSEEIHEYTVTESSSAL